MPVRSPAIFFFFLPAIFLKSHIHDGTTIVGDDNEVVERDKPDPTLITPYGH